MLRCEFGGLRRGLADASKVESHLASSEKRGDQAQDRMSIFLYFNCKEGRVWAAHNNDTLLGKLILGPV